MRAWLHAVIGAYLTITLAMTAIAKVRRRAPVAASWAWELHNLLRRPVSRRHVVSFVISLCVCEIGLATAIALDRQIGATAVIACGVFLLFGLYRLIVFWKTGESACLCAGTRRNVALSWTATLGAASADVVLAGLAIGWALTGPGGGWVAWLPALALVVPFGFWIATAWIRSARVALP
ncbi:hypothetical protein [Asanoa iriomotensis]|uniref:Methylamine utilization protein MauE n=1 Tax=Asanoa iriomotensis TaxID=234613 RepID=A0ABQ4C4D2_9ACTN|nr:hypothetical protein [Asanoa iriomotensis]GIF57619.1 hypothetical protein Air01nite_37140 [Asanoa iriomotensis]